MEMDTQPPGDERTNVIAAFQGWNDAGQAATTAVRYLIDQWDAKPFARLDADEYFSFTDTRPQIRIVDGNQRELVWPSNEFYYFGGAPKTPPCVLLLGTEPNLRWRSFCDEVIGLAEMLSAQRVFTMGALVADAVHTRPVPLTGFSTEAEMQNKFLARSVNRANYQGPTGIVGTLHNLAVKAQIPAASVWAATPYYLGSTPNPKTALGLLDILDEALELNMNLSELRGVADEFVQQVSMAVKDNDEVQERIRMLEQAHDERATAGQPADFPETGTIIADLESFLREKRAGE
jgi:proteasome assembly chaperone (PAC2) family protein